MKDHTFPHVHKKNPSNPSRWPVSVILTPTSLQNNNTDNSAENPFADRSQHDLNANPFDNNGGKNPFEHPNDSAFSLDSQDTARGLGRSQGAAAAPVAAALASGGWTSGWGSSRPAETTESSLEAREAALRAREDEIRRREEALGLKENNWPPCMYSILIRSIEEADADQSLPLFTSQNRQLAR